MKYTPALIENTEFNLRRTAPRTKEEMINDLGSVEITSAPSSNEITWNAIPGFDRYRIQITRQSDGELVVNRTVTATSFTPDFDATTGHDRQVFTARKITQTTEITITGTSISPSTATVEEGSTLELTGSVQGTGSYNTSGTWTRESGDAIPFTVDGNTITISPGATDAGQQAVFRFTSDGDNSQFSERTITVTEESSYTPQDSSAGDKLFLDELYAATQGQHLEVLDSVNDLPSPANSTDLDQYIIDGDLWFFEGDYRIEEWQNRGPVWTDKTNWNNGDVDLSNPPVGVTVNTVGGELRVTSIDMQKITTAGTHNGDPIWDGNNLAGFLPESWGNLTKCTYFNIKQNFFIGSIPDTLQSGALFEKISLGGQEGDVSTKESGIGSNRDHRGIEGSKEYEERNKFSGPLPASLMNCPNIYVFECRRQYVSGGLPPEWGILTSLKFIYLNDQKSKGENKFGGTLPSEWGTNGLDPSVIDISAKATSRDPNFSGEMEFTGGVPQSWQDNWTELTVFWVRENPLGGTVPNFVNVRSIRVYSITDCGMSSPGDGFFFPEFLFAAGNNSSLTYIQVAENNLSGSLRQTIPDITFPQEKDFYDFISIFDISGYGITGDLPDWVRGMSKIKQLNLGGNEFTSGFPVELAEANFMRLFWIANFTDGNPTTLPDVNFGEDIYSVLMGNNAFEGPFPASWSSLAENSVRGIWRFHAQNNDLEGLIPLWFKDMTNSKTSGSLTTGRKYIIETYNAGDDFTNVGASVNEQGEEFTATGSTPADWTNGSKLSTPTLERLDISENRFTYADILPNYQAIYDALTENTGVSGSRLSAPDYRIHSQKPFRVGQTTYNFSVGQTVTVDLSSIDYANNVYQWLRNGSPVSGQTSHTLSISNAQTSDSGLYQLRITNSDLTGHEDPDQNLEESLSEEIIINVE